MTSTGRGGVVVRMMFIAAMLTGAHLVAPVRSGSGSENGILVKL
ncbi:hypothetical protein OHB54_44590 [Streptomyces sp. NBC_01007]|nr:hypothetical protein OHB54_44590 [Streptomyces sp. NBC_01007]